MIAARALQALAVNALEPEWESRFEPKSYGFRPGRGCHTALREVEDVWSGTTGFIEGDISDCFGSLDHEIMVSILAEKIHDNRFLRLVRNMLTAGYLEVNIQASGLGVAVRDRWLRLGCGDGVAGVAGRGCGDDCLL